jgi:hypothetical protein
LETKSQTVIAKYLHDMHSLLRHGHDAIRRQRDNLKDSGHPDAQAAVARWEETLDRHLAMLDERLKGIGESTTSPIQDAAASAAGAAAGLYNAVRSEEASKSVRDDYTFFSHCAIAYLMLHTTAASLDDRETARVAERGYRDMARMVEEVDDLMPGLVIAELRQDGLAPQDVSAECRRLISEAWRGGVQRSGA